MNNAEEFKFGSPALSPKKKNINEILKKNFANNGFEISEQENVCDKNGKNHFDIIESKNDPKKPLVKSNNRLLETNGIHTLSETNTSITSIYFY